jgi:hypothetical protein
MKSALFNVNDTYKLMLRAPKMLKRDNSHVLSRNDADSSRWVRFLRMSSFQSLTASPPLLPEQPRVTSVKDDAVRMGYCNNP